MRSSVLTGIIIVYLENVDFGVVSMRMSVQGLLSVVLTGEAADGYHRVKLDICSVSLRVHIRSLAPPGG